MLNGFQEKGTGALLFSGEGNWCSVVFRRRKLVVYSFQEKETGALSTTVHRIGEGNRCSTVLMRRKKVLYCFSGEGNWCSTVLRRRGKVLYCFQEKETGALQFSGERN